MLDIQPHEWERIHRIGYQHQLLGEWEIARSHYEQALSLNPDYAFAQLSLAQLDMLQSRFSEGRERYEARFGARDNNGFDWQFINWYFHHFLGDNPFGFSSTNLGSLYKGLAKDTFVNFKHLRKTRHTHHPVDDARGNAEALLAMKETMGLKISFD